MGSAGGLSPGDKFLDRFEVVRELGRGYTGIVYELYNYFTRQSYALKLMHAPSEHQVSRLSAEASLLIKIDHKHVVKVHDAGQLPDGRGWLLMDLLQGCTLADLLKKGPLAPLQAIHHILGITWGVAAAHELGVIHRDLKPANVFIVDETNVAKVLDFSGAKYMHSDLRTTKPPDMTGTIAYMSPQQIDGEAADGRMDVYALGLIFFEMLTGKSPWFRYFNNIHRLAVAQATEMPPLVATKLGLPACFDEVIQRATAKEAEDRYPTPTAFAQAVIECRRQLEERIAAGTFKVEKRPGEPSLQDRDSRHEYAAPQAVVRADTAPVEPAERITITPRAPEERSASSAPGPTGTVRLSEVQAVVAETRRAAATGRPTPPSQVPTEKLRKTPPGDPRPSHTSSAESTDPLPRGVTPVTIGTAASQPPALANAGSGGPFPCAGSSSFPPRRSCAAPLEAGAGARGRAGAVARRRRCGRRDPAAGGRRARLRGSDPSGADRGRARPRPAAERGALGGGRGLGRARAGPGVASLGAGRERARSADGGRVGAGEGAPRCAGGGALDSAAEEAAGSALPAGCVRPQGGSGPRSYPPAAPCAAPRIRH